jgi:prepilin-type processing-associated H-X9-DG protein
MRTSATNRRREAAFSLFEVIVVIIACSVLAGILWIYSVKSHQKAVISRCVANLKQLGLGMALYEEANDTQLPYACLKYNNNNFETWDHLIYPFVREETDITGIATPQEFLSAERIFRCPADRIKAQANVANARRRTYSMAGHYPDKKNWPLGPDNNTGVGLSWTDTPNTEFDSIDNVIHASGHIPSFRLNMIPAPAGTLILAEKPRAANILFNFNNAEIAKAAESLSAALPDQYHKGRFNYLMVDGHVETLLPEQTMGKPIGNIWTIRPDD